MGNIQRNRWIGEKAKEMSIWFRQNLYAKIYCFLTAWFLLAFLSTLYISHGISISNFLFKDKLDTGMDFFNSVENTKGGHPYTQFRTLYPPLANLVFWLVQECVPRDIVSQWPNSLSGSVAMRGTDGDLRVYQVTAFAFLLFVVFVASMIIFVHSYLFESAREGMAFGMAVLLSYSGMFALERGNIVLYAYLFLMVFIRFYRSEKRWLRELAYFSLAISAGLKLYPALFGLLVLYEKRWKDALRLILYGCMAVFLPFIKFDGFQGMEVCFGSVLNFADTGISKSPYSVSSYSVEHLVRGLCYQLSSIFQTDYTAMVDGIESHIGIIKWLCIIILAVASLLLKDRWKKLLAIGCIVLFIQKSGGYTLLFLFPALALLCRENDVNRRNTIYFILLCCIELPLPIMIRLDAYEVYLLRIVQCDAILVIVLIMIWEMCAQINLKSLYRKVGAAKLFVHRETN